MIAYQMYIDQQFLFLAYNTETEDIGEAREGKPN